MTPAIPKTPIPHLSALLVAILAPLAGIAVVLVAKLDPAAVPYVAGLSALVGAGGFSAHVVALFNQGRGFATAALPTLESIVGGVVQALRGQNVAPDPEPVDYAKLADSLEPRVLRALPGLIAIHVSPTPAPPITLTPDAAPTVPALPHQDLDTSPAAIALSKRTLAAAAALGLALMLAGAAFLGCSAQQAAKDEAAVKVGLRDLARADVVCVAFSAGLDVPAIASACRIGAPSVTAIQDGLAAVDDIRAGVSAGPDITAAFLAAQQAVAASKSADAGGQ